MGGAGFKVPLLLLLLGNLLHLNELELVDEGVVVVEEQE